VNYKVKTPVAFFIYKRPVQTERVFARIVEARPSKLFIIADGPSENNADDAEACQACRELVRNVTWDCQVETNFSQVNLGIQERIASGLNWVFDQEEEAIIIEDDCLPSASFFRYCDELLERYRNDTRIMAISGDNFQFGAARRYKSYYFSRYTHVWGWATWRRSWSLYDAGMETWPEVKRLGYLNDILADARSVAYWTDIFQRVYDRAIKTWDYPFLYSSWIQNGLCILPEKNLVTNIGFGKDGTHCTDSESDIACMAAEEIDFPLTHAATVVRDAEADEFTQRNIFERP
jgi:hypothetical protein